MSLQLQGHDADSDTLTYTATGLPAGLTVNSSTGLISGTLAANADISSPYNVTVTASDGTHTTSQTFLWTVSQVALTAPSDPTNTEGDSVSLQLQGATSSGSPTYSASGLPDGLSINAATGLISGTITAGAAANGPFTVDVAASNGVVSTSQTFTWNVNPVVNLTAPADQSNNEGESVSLQMSATDSLNRTLSYSADGLPSGLSINSSTGLISGTITGGDVSGGPYVVTVTASDGTYSSSVTFNWNVTDTAALTLTNPDTQVNVAGDSVSLQIHANDPDGDVLTYSVVGLPDEFDPDPNAGLPGGLTIDPSTGIISGVLADDAASEMPYQVTVTATDGNGQSVSQTFTWIVNAPPITAQASPVNLVEGVDPGSFTVATFTTADLNSLPDDFLAIIDYGDGTTDTGAISGGNGNFTVTGDHVYAEKGSYPVSIQIADSLTGASTTVTSTATVADAALHLTGGFQLSDPITNPPTTFTLASFTDDNPDAPASDYSVTIVWGDGTQTSGYYLQDTDDGLYQIVAPHTYTLPFGTVGPLTYTVTVTLTDTDGSSASTTSTIVVGQLQAGTAAQMSNWEFEDQNTYAKASDFVYNGQSSAALINWGDGTSSVGTVTGGPGTGNGPVFFYVVGTHTYTQDSYDQPSGQYTITVTVTDTDGSTLTGTQFVSVVRPPLALDVANVDIASSLTVSNVPVAAFAVADGTDAASEFTAQIDWGDGSVSSGVIQEISPGLFQVLGSHTYATYDWYTMTVAISQGWGGQVTEGDKPGKVGGGVMIKYFPRADGNIPLKTLNVGSWRFAFMGKGKNMQLRPGNFISHDPARFYVRVKDLTAWKTMQTIRVYVEASSDPGHYITLTKTGVVGLYQSQALLLTSVRVDKDEGGNQAFMVKLGNTIKVVYGEKEATITVPVQKEVKLHINILRDAKGGKAAATKPEVKADVVWANKIYAPLGIHFTASYDTVDPPKNNKLDLNDGLQWRYIYAPKLLDDNEKFKMTPKNKPYWTMMTFGKVVIIPSWCIMSNFWQTRITRILSVWANPSILYVTPIPSMITASSSVQMMRSTRP